MRQDYVLAFAFNADRSKVLLIRKNRPAWQAGKLNGIGGKIDPGENPLAAMRREFFEECGIQTENGDWHYYMKIIGRDGDVWCYRMFDDKILTAKSMLDEEVVITDVSLDAIIRESISNLAWLIGIALDDNQPNFFVEANYNQEFLTGQITSHKTGT